MDWGMVWAFAQSGTGIAVQAFLLVLVLNWVFSKKPAWAGFEGTIVEAIRKAEKAVPDETENKGLAKFDSALKHVLKVYEERRGKKASPKVEAELAEAVKLKHNDLAGGL